MHKKVTEQARIQISVFLRENKIRTKNQSFFSKCIVLPIVTYCERKTIRVVHVN